MRLSERLIRRTWKIVLPIILSVLLGLLGMGWYSRNKARELHQRLADIQIGQTSFEQASKIAKAFGGTPADCSNRSCTYSFLVENQLLSNTSLIRPAAFRASLSIREGRVQYVWYELRTEERRATTAIRQILSNGDIDPMFVSLQVARSVTESDEVHVVYLGQTPWRVAVSASAESKLHLSFQPQMACLATLIDCSDAAGLIVGGLPSEHRSVPSSSAARLGCCEAGGTREND
jgi:hypothetical protein